MIWRSGDYILKELKDYIDNLKYTNKKLREKVLEKDSEIEKLKKQIEYLKGETDDKA